MADKIWGYWVNPEGGVITIKRDNGHSDVANKYIKDHELKKDFINSKIEVSSGYMMHLLKWVRVVFDTSAEGTFGVNMAEGISKKSFNSLIKLAEKAYYEVYYLDVEHTSITYSGSQFTYNDRQLKQFIRKVKTYVQ